MRTNPSAHYGRLRLKRVRHMSDVLLPAFTALMALPSGARSAFAAPPVPEHQVETLAADMADISWTLRPGQPPITDSEIWFTEDHGQTWTRSPESRGVASQAATSTSFKAPRDGLFGIYLVFANAQARTPAPVAGAKPHRWIRFDRALPMVKLLTNRVHEHFDVTREIELRWQVDDASLPDRPVAIHYRPDGGRAFQLVEQNLPAEGALRWTVPAGAFNKLTLKISAVDRAGNRGVVTRDIGLPGPESKSTASPEGQPLSPAGGDVQPPASDIRARPSAPTAPVPVSDKSQPVAHAAPDVVSDPTAGESAPVSGAAKEAARLYDQATWHRLRGEYDVALARYCDALERLPVLHTARCDMAGVYVLLDDLEAAEEQYERVLEIEPRDRTALKGLALVQARSRRYRTAHATLQKLLLLAPDDAEAWLHFGDVCIFIGDRPAARDAWQRVTALEAAGVELKSRASRRLELYPADVGAAR